MIDGNKVAGDFWDYRILQLLYMRAQRLKRYALALITLAFIQPSQAQSDAPPPLNNLPPMDNVWHGVQPEVFDKILASLRAQPYQLDKNRDGSPVDYIDGKCGALLEGLRKGEAALVAPEFTTEDFNDPRLEGYKQRYRQYLANAVPAEKRYANDDWFGGWVEEQSLLLYRPTRHFALYQLPIGLQQENMVVFYGEVVVEDSGEPAGGEKDIKFANTSSYSFFSNTPTGLKNIYSFDDPSKYFDAKEGRHLEHYTEIFRWNGSIYHVRSWIDKNDGYYSAEVELMAGSKIATGKVFPSIRACSFAATK